MPDTTPISTQTPLAQGAPARDDLYVGRERELGQIAAALDGAAAGRGQLIMLIGEPGIGKTSLADRAAERAARGGFSVLWGRCWEAGGAPAYWPWLDLLAELVRGLDDAALARALGDGAPLLGALVPDVPARMADAATGAAPPAEEGRFRLWRAVSALVHEAARAKPLCIVLEDLHACDQSSLSLLYFLARQLRPMRALVIGTYRDVEARMDAGTSDLLSRIGREASPLVLPRLQREAAAQFVKARVGAVDSRVEARLLDGAQGNPLFLGEMVRLWNEQGAAAITEGVVPDGVRDVIRQRLDRLARDAHALLELAAVAGDTIDPPLLVAAAAQDAAWVSARLAEAGRVGAVVPRDGRLRFGHALFREVLYRDLAEDRRRALHGQVAAALERSSPAQIAEIAHHALAGPRDMLDRAVDHAIRAAARAQELLAYDEAVTTLERARAAVAVEGNPPAARARVLLALGEARIRRGEAAVGKDYCSEAAAAARELGDVELAAQAALIYGRVFTFAFVDPVLVALLEESLRALPPGDSALRARLLARLAAALQPSVNNDEPVRAAHEAIAIARRLGDSAALLDTLYAAISALMDAVDPAETRDLNLEAAQLAAALGDRERLLRTHLRLAVSHLGTGELEACDARLAAFDALATELRAPWFAWWGEMARAVRATMSGQFAEAQRLAAAAREAGTAAGQDAAERVWTTSRQGRLRAAEQHEDFRAFEPEVRRSRSYFHMAAAWQALDTALMHARLEQGAEARAYLDLLPETFRSSADNRFPLFFVAEAIAIGGPRELAEQLYPRITPMRDRYVMLGLSYMAWEGPWARVIGLLAAYLERWDEATEAFEDAIARCRRLGARPYLARTEYELARALLARGRPADADRARALIASARAAAHELGMPGLVRLADDRLARIGAGAGAGAGTRAGTGVAPAPARASEFSFTREGEYWTVSHAGGAFRLKDSLGLRYLVRLIDQPGRELHVLDLVGERAGGGGSNETIDTGDAGELLDDEARRSYQNRIEDLEETIAEAESFGDPARAAAARAEMEALGAELGRAVGLGGRARRAGGAAERARSAVQRRIKNAIERIGEHAPDLAALLARAIRTGNFCEYRPERT
jgi:hypothetical protein